MIEDATDRVRRRGGRAEGGRPEECLKAACSILAVVVVLAIVFDFINGFHDTANAIATVVATRVLSPGQAILMAAALNFLGAMTGTAVAKTVGAGWSTRRHATELAVVAALLAAIIWNLITWYRGIPSSSSHALIGGILGAASRTAGLDAPELGRGGGQGARCRWCSRRSVGFSSRLIVMVVMLRPVRHGPSSTGSTRIFGAAAARLLGLHGLQPRRQRRPEDDGHHHPGAAGYTAVSSELRRPLWVILAAAIAMAARHRHGRLADHPNDGHRADQAAADRRLRRRNRGGHGDRGRHRGSASR